MANQSYNVGNLPGAPIPLSMLPEASALTDNDFAYLFQPGNTPGQQCRRMALLALKNYMQSNSSIKFYEVEQNASVDVSQDVAAIVGFTFGTPEPTVTSISFSINGVLGNTHIRAILLQGGLGMTTRKTTVTIDSGNTIEIPEGCSAIVFVDRYNDALVLSTSFIPTTTATAYFAKVSTKSTSQGGGSEATMSPTGFSFADSTVTNAKYETLVEDSTLKTRLGDSTNYVETAYDTDDGARIKVSASSSGGGSSSEVTPSEVKSPKFSINGGNSIQNDTNGDLYAAAQNNQPTTFTASYFRATQGAGIIVADSDVDLTSTQYTSLKQGAMIFIANKSSNEIHVLNGFVSSVAIASGYGKMFVKTTEGFFAC